MGSMKLRLVNTLLCAGCWCVASAVDLSRIQVSCGVDSREVRAAADVLTNHLSLVCGSVVGSEGVEFVLGVPPPGGKVAKRDESRVCVQGGKVYLWGDDSVLEGSQNRKGTMMAVSGFLEDRLGIHWVWPGLDGMVFKHARNIDLPEGWNWRYVPPFGMQTYRATSPNRFMRRSGITPVEFHRAPEDRTNMWRDCVQWVDMMRLQTRKIFPYRHAFIGWQRRFLKSHPDYLAKTGADQRGMRPNQEEYVKLCVSNPKVVDQIVADWKMKGAPEYINICPNDYNRGFCLCPNCKKLDVEPYKGKPQGNLSDRYVNFWNRIVEKARAIRPDVKAVTYIYSLYKSPPIRERIAYPDNMVFGLVPLLTDDLQSHIMGWKTVGMKNFFLRPNWLNYRAATMRGLERVLYNSFKTAADAGALGFDFDNGLHAPQINLERYVAGRLLSFPGMSFEKICAEYYSAYGAAAPEVRRWHECLRTHSEATLEQLRHAVRGQVPKADDSQYSNVFALSVPVDEMARYEMRLREARCKIAAKLSPIEMKRLDDLILRLVHDQLTRRFFESDDDERSLMEIGEDLLSFRLRHRDRLNYNWCDVISDDYTERALWKKFYRKSSN